MMNLLEAEVGKTYEIKEIRTDDDEMNAFLFRDRKSTRLNSSHQI